MFLPLTFLIALSAIVSCDGQPTLVDESPAIQSVFEEYRTALLNQDGTAASNKVSSGTIAEYERYRRLALYGDERTIKALSMANRMQVLLIRHRVELNLLESLDGKGIFALAVARGWIGKDGAIRTGLTSIAIGGPRATAKLTVDGKPTEETYHFSKENERWTLDLVPSIKRSDQVLQQLVHRKGVSENEFLFSVITTASGQQVSETIWKPLTPLAPPTSRSATQDADKIGGKTIN